VAHHFELAARKVLAGFLQDDEEGVGAHLSVDHLAPCAVGKRVRVRAELVEVTGGQHRRVVCAVSAWDGDRLLARGRQVQVVMNKDHLGRYLERS
jgi:predicted thioesterase